MAVAELRKFIVHGKDRKKSAPGFHYFVLSAYFDCYQLVSTKEKKTVNIKWILSFVNQLLLVKLLLMKAHWPLKCFRRHCQTAIKLVTEELRLGKQKLPM